ncbi:hypothetical protein BVE84_04855 [Streptococcus azizii]|uniref:Bacteriocin n=1 Tax=Streptococcus azizii TaxID=1579424 RepID=A0AB36JMM3_9STRE|nr:MULTISPECIES: hypothetical protein [Streptococcus]MBF0776749.1 hypothetical protein [Streptococcus sp. 19428wD3_AN2]ONK27551.1 hypothetical protein BVE85_06420 [Streptococcus azizii]ONK27672.1 hypothetical protein BVE86_04695 [Streptococcus azizii]ONK29852.1 hypothetical protein BVE84_04855 [Streptococcus azizii]TFU82486.1 hypothetical protein E4T83_08345 [Streptococcus sp. AN2]
MRKIKKLLLVGVSVGILLGLTPAPVLATTTLNQLDSSVLGGWSEELGNFTNSQDNGISERFAFRAAQSPVHGGKREDRWNSGGAESRAVGWTVWEGVHHYTRAQMVEWKGLGGVSADSGRIWGTGGTRAYSGWVYEGELLTHIAKTFYGR